MRNWLTTRLRTKPFMALFNSRATLPWRDLLVQKTFCSSMANTKPNNGCKSKKKKAAQQRANKRKKENDERNRNVPPPIMSPHERQARYRKLKRQKNLHLAAKWKRILSACDFWFSRSNLVQDTFLLQTLRKHNGWIPVSTLLTFPKFHHWTDAPLLVQAFQSTGGVPRYEVTYDPVLWNKRPSRAPSSKKDGKTLDINMDTTVNVEWKDQEQKLQAIEQSLLEHCGDAGETLETTATTLNVVSPSVSVKEPPQILLENAAVRHRKVNLDTIELLMEQESLQDNEVDCGFSNDDDSGLEHDFSNDDPELENDAAKLLRPTKRYRTQRPIVIVRRPSDLPKFCLELGQSIQEHAQKHNDHPQARAIGLDVEYCSLELDIRKLPAMLQIASPSPNGPIGLIWLDKFPNHGRDLYKANLPQTHYQPLVELLQDGTVLKVGVNLHQDVRNLASWWRDESVSDQFVVGVVDLEELDDVPRGDHQNDDSSVELLGMSLAEMVQSVLQRDLPKLKSAHRSDKKKRKKSTSHWRRDELTRQMKEYAAHDAAAAVDVWNQWHGFV